MFHADWPSSALHFRPTPFWSCLCAADTNQTRLACSLRSTLLCRRCHLSVYRLSLSLHQNILTPSLPFPACAQSRLRTCMPNHPRFCRPNKTAWHFALKTAYQKAICLCLLSLHYTHSCLTDALHGDNLVSTHHQRMFQHSVLYAWLSSDLAL